MLKISMIACRKVGAPQRKSQSQYRDQPARPIFGHNDEREGRADRNDRPRNNPRGRGVRSIPRTTAGGTPGRLRSALRRPGWPSGRAAPPRVVAVIRLEELDDLTKVRVQLGEPRLCRGRRSLGGSGRSLCRVGRCLRGICRLRCGANLGDKRVSPLCTRNLGKELGECHSQRAIVGETLLGEARHDLMDLQGRPDAVRHVLRQRHVRSPLRAEHLFDPDAPEHDADLGREEDK